MTGIDRLRELGNDYAEHSWSEAGKSRGMLMLNIADQIESERACDADTIENVRLIVGGVIDDMERHVSGVEGADDSPVARWARELRGALKSDASDSSEQQKPSWHDHADAAGVTSEAAEVTRYPAEDVSMSAYDLLPSDERDAIAWVREHGGLDRVRAEWRSRVPRDRYESRRQRLLGHIAECETALGRRNRRIEELGHRVSDLTRENAELRRRAIPEGVKWPRYESGEPVGFGDEVSRLGEVFSISLYCDGSFALNFRSYSKGDRVKRPAVPAADGEPLEVGQTVWPVEGGGPLYVDRVDVGGRRVTTRPFGLSTALDEMEFEPSQLTHTKPEPPDSAERIADEIDRLREEVALHLGDYLYDEDGNDSIQFSMELVAKRCRALAERERGE